MMVRQTLQLCLADTVELSAADYPLNYNIMPEVMVYAFLQDDHTSGMFYCGLLLPGEASG